MLINVKSLINNTLQKVLENFIYFTNQISFQNRKQKITKQSYGYYILSKLKHKREIKKKL